MKKKENKDVQHKETRGGARQGAGAKLKYGEQTKQIVFRCPESKVEEIKKVISSKLSKWRVN
jgi:hypothetical protein